MNSHGNRLTPSVARMMNWSLDANRRWEISGKAITPWFLSRKSPKARDMARPGVSSCGNHTLWMCGSSFRASTLPLHFLILSASPENYSFNSWFVRNYSLPKEKKKKKERKKEEAILGTVGFKSVVNWTGMISFSLIVPNTALESPRLAITRSSPCLIFQYKKKHEQKLFIKIPNLYACT